MKKKCMVIFFFVFCLFEEAESCDVHQTKYSCEYFSPCKWDNGQCVLGPRGLNYDSDTYAIFKNFKPLLNFHLGKAKTKSPE